MNLEEYGITPIFVEFLKPLVQKVKEAPPNADKSKGWRIALQNCARLTGTLPADGNYKALLLALAIGFERAGAGRNNKELHQALRELGALP